MKKILLKSLIGVGVLLCGSALATHVPAMAKKSYVAAINKNGMPKKVVTKYVPVPMPGQLKALHAKYQAKSHHAHQSQSQPRYSRLPGRSMPITKSSMTPFRLPKTQTKKLKGIPAVTSANKKAIQQPNSDEYINSIMTFDFMEGALYQIYCAPLRVTDVQFGSHEHIISVAAGDTLRWQVSKTYSGSGLHRYEHIVIKPTADNLTNSLVVTTDKHTYHLQLQSTSDTYMASVKWRYPQGDGLVEMFENDAGGIGSQAAIPASGMSLNQLDFTYTVDLVSGKVPDWMPSMVFNDGRKTYIQFPSAMQEAPALFIGTNAKNAEVVNYRVQGNYYIVDRVFPYAQLRSGQKSQTIVRITRGNR